MVSGFFTSLSSGESLSMLERKVSLLEKHKAIIHLCVGEGEFWTEGGKAEYGIFTKLAPPQ